MYVQYTGTYIPLIFWDKKNGIQVCICGYQTIFIVALSRNDIMSKKDKRELERREREAAAAPGARHENK